MKQPKLSIFIALAITSNYVAAASEQQSYAGLSVDVLSITKQDYETVTTPAVSAELGFKPTNWFGLETNWGAGISEGRNQTMKNGSPQEFTARVNYYGSAYLVFAIPLNQRFDLIAKGGGSYVSLDHKDQINNEHDSYASASPSWSLIGEYSTKDIAFYFGYKSIFQDKQYRVDGITFGFNYNYY